MRAPRQGEESAALCGARLTPRPFCAGYSNRSMHLPAQSYRPRFDELRTRSLSFLTANRQYLQIAFIAVLAVPVLIEWVQTVQTILRYYTPLPIWDYWRVVEDLEPLKALHLEVLWRQHNEHRMLFPKVIFQADMLLFHGQQIFTLAISFLCYVGILAVIAWCLLTDANLSPTICAGAVLLAGLLMGWHGSAQVLGVPFLLQWTLLQVMVFLALGLIAWFKQRPRPAYLAASISCAVIASYSAANGLCLWPILLLAAWILSLERRHVLTLAAAAAICIALFFVGYHSRGSLNLRNFVAHPGYCLGFLASYLSMPFGAAAHASPGVGLGFLSVAAFLVLFGIAVRSRLISTMPGLVLFGSYAFTLATAVLISAGRMNLTDPTFGAAKAARFVTIPLVAWAVLIAAAVWIVYRKGWKAYSYGLALVIFVILLKSFPKVKRWVEIQNNVVSEQHVAVLSIENGIFDVELVRKIYPDPAFVSRFLPVLRRNHVSIYSLGYPKWLGEPAMSEFVPPWRSLEAGAITQTFPVRAGLEVVGWADGVRRASYSPQIVFLDDSDRIAGFGRRLGTGLPSHLASLQTPSRIAWIGFISLADKSKSFSAYTIDRRVRALAPIGEPIAFPAVQVAGPEEIGEELTEVHWVRDSTWTKYLLPPRVDAGSSPADFYSSWSGSDRNTGAMISLPIDVSSNHCLVLPVLHGSSVEGLSVQLIGTAGNEVLATVPMQGDDTRWRFWRVPLNASIAQVRIDAEDRGRDWGQWLAVGDPYKCR